MKIYKRLKFKKTILIIAVVIFSLLLSFATFYFTYTPDYESAVKAEVLTALNNDWDEEDYPERGWRTESENQLEGTQWSEEWYMSTYDISWRSSDDLWYSWHAKRWQIETHDLAFSDNYLALPFLVKGKRLIYVFRHDGDRWVFDQKIDKKFQGWTYLELDEDVLAVSDTTGVHIFRRSNERWELEHLLESQHDQLDISLDKDVLAVFSSSGSIKVFRHKQAGWFEEADIYKELFPAVNLAYPHAVLLDGNELVVINNDNIYSFGYTRGDWNLAYRQPIDDIPGLPEDVLEAGKLYASMHNGTLVLGQPKQNIVYVLEKTNEQWSLTEEISENTFPELNLNSQYSSSSFGDSVTIRNNTLVVAEEVYSIYVFTRKNANDQWVLEHITPPGNHRFSQLIITSSNTILVIESEELFSLKRNP